ncbi:MAG: HDOD domain-containing protein [Gammaproteobacteria bacterium]|nr:HDOD domain-containing protein [Gammaproteobacteria bacterium]
MAKALDTWFDFLKDRPLPTQAATALRIQQTLNRAFASHQDFAEILRFAPGMAIELFRSLRRLPEPPKVPIEGLSHAVAMLGLEPLQMACLRMPSIERLAEEAIPGLRLCYSRAIQSAHFARRWAELKKLSHPDAISLAALMDECGEMALWTNAPEQMIAINQLRASGSTTDDAALQVLGTTLNRLSRRLAEYWSLPPLTVQSLTYNVYEPRPLCVVLATNFARTIDTSWINPKSDLLLELIQEFLNKKADPLLAMVHQQAAEIAREAAFTGLPMAIHHLPFIPDLPVRLAPRSATRPAPIKSTPKTAPEPAAETFAEATPKPTPSAPVAKPKPAAALQPEAAEAAPAPAEVGQGQNRAAVDFDPFSKQISQLLNFLHRKADLARCMYAALDEQQQLVASRVVGVNPDPLKAFSHPLRGTIFFALMQKPSSFWLNSSNRDKYRSLIPQDAGDWAQQDSLMMPLFCNGKVRGLFYADNNGRTLNEIDFQRFKTAVNKFIEVMEHNQRCVSPTSPDKPA